MELVDMRDSKSLEHYARAGSSPARGTKNELFGKLPPSGAVFSSVLRKNTKEYKARALLAQRKKFVLIFWSSYLLN